MMRFINLSVAAICLGLTACSTSPSQSKATAQGAGESPLQIIDAHTHTSFDGKPEATSKIPNTKEEYLREMKEAGVVGAVSHSPPDKWNGEDLRAEGVVHCAGISAHVNAAKLEAVLKSGRFACIKIYLGYVHQFAYDKNYEPAYKLAEKYNVPVVFHTGDTYSTEAKLKYSDPLTIDEVAVDHPKVTFVIAHCGNPWIESAAEVAYKNPNVYLDGSAFLIGDLSKIKPETIDTYLVHPIAFVFGYVDDPKKLMFGTDWPLVGMKQYVDAFKRAIPKEYWQAVFHDNAARVFKIKR
jgi:uncharacterized protein